MLSLIKSLFYFRRQRKFTAHLDRVLAARHA